MNFKSILVCLLILSLTFQTVYGIMIKQTQIHNFASNNARSDSLFHKHMSANIPLHSQATYVQLQHMADGNEINADGFGNITIEGTVNTNPNNASFVLRTANKYQFINVNEMENFMKTSFPDSTVIPTVYCSQREEPDLDLYDCLIVYSSGIPNKKFKIIFSFDFKGQKGKIQVQVDPLKSSKPSRSRRIREL